MSASTAIPHSVFPKRVVASLATLLCVTGLALGAAVAAQPDAAPPAAKPPKPVDDISQAAIQSAFQILRSEYIRSDDLTFDELNRAALQGLLSRLDFGAELLRHNGNGKQPEPSVYGELLTPEIGYARPETFAAAEAPMLEKVLAGFVRDKAASLILDLRVNTEPASFDTAAAMLDLFIPRGELMFKLKQIGRENSELFLARSDPVWTGPIVALVDEDTCNVGETIAAVLRHRGKTLLVGAATRGGTVRYETVPVDDNWELRFARAEMLLDDDTSLFKKGLTPEFKVPFPIADKRRLFLDTRGRSLKPHVFDKSRERYNEAALVSRTNPELDAFIKRSHGAAIAEDKMPPRDLVLQRAVDMLRSSSYLDAAKIRWPEAKPTAPETAPPARNLPAGK